MISTFDVCKVTLFNVNMRYRKHPKTVLT